MGEFFVILLIVVGYFLFFSWILSHSDKRWSVSAMLFVALLVYGSVVGMCIAIGQYLGEMGLMLYGVAIVYSCLYGCWKIYTIFRERLKIKLSVLLMLIAYVVAVFYITIFMREEGSNNHVQMEVMHWAYSDDRGRFSMWRRILRCLCRSGSYARFCPGKTAEEACPGRFFRAAVVCAH